MARKKKGRGSGKHTTNPTANEYVKKVTKPNPNGSRKAIVPAKTAPLKTPQAKPKTKVIHQLDALYNSIVLSKEKFNPEIKPEVFAQICACFLKEEPNETAGYFHWEQETNEIVWSWSDPEDNIQTSSHVIYGTARVRMAWDMEGRSGIPNGQWHTHPGMAVYWSTTDKESQLSFIAEMISNSPEGYYCFIVLDELDWLATRLIWKDGKIVSRESGKVHINGVPLSGVKHFVDTATYGYYPQTNWGKKKSTPWDQNLRPKELESGKELSEEERAEIDTKYKGDIPKEDAYYIELFNTFFIPLYEWDSLKEMIDQVYPGQYDDIINERVSWVWLRADYDYRWFA